MSCKNSKRKAEEISDTEISDNESLVSTEISDTESEESEIENNTCPKKTCKKNLPKRKYVRSGKFVGKNKKNNSPTNSVTENNNITSTNSVSSSTNSVSSKKSSKKSKKELQENEDVVIVTPPVANTMITTTNITSTNITSSSSVTSSPKKVQKYVDPKQLIKDRSENMKIQSFNHCFKEDDKTKLKFEALVFVGTDSHESFEWYSTIVKLLMENQSISSVYDFDHPFYLKSQSGRIDFVFPFAKHNKINIQRLAMWRLTSYSSLHGKWLSDYVDQEYINH